MEGNFLKINFGKALMCKYLNNLITISECGWAGEQLLICTSRFSLGLRRTSHTDQIAVISEAELKQPQNLITDTEQFSHPPSLMGNVSIFRYIGASGYQIISILCSEARRSDERIRRSSLLLPSFVAMDLPGGESSRLQEETNIFLL